MLANRLSGTKLLLILFLKDRFIKESPFLAGERGFMKLDNCISEHLKGGSHHPH